MSDEYVTIKNCTIGTDSNSGDAFLATIDGEGHWVPYSQVKSLVRTHNKGEDSFQVRRWLAEKKEWVIT